MVHLANFVLNFLTASCKKKCEVCGFLNHICRNDCSNRRTALHGCGVLKELELRLQRQKFSLWQQLGLVILLCTHPLHRHKQSVHLLLFKHILPAQRQLLVLSLTHLIVILYEKQFQQDQHTLFHRFLLTCHFLTYRRKLDRHCLHRYKIYQPRQL
jgi:hypothetical protein